MIKKVKVMAAAFLLTLGSVSIADAAGVSVSCSNGTCVINSQCSGTLTVQGSRVRVFSSSRNGVTTNTVTVDGVVVLQETCN